MTARREAAPRLIALEKQSDEIKGDVDVGHVADLSLVEESLRYEPDSDNLPRRTRKVA